MDSIRRRKQRPVQRWVLLSTCFILILACTMPGAASTPDASLHQTEIAMGVQQTVMAQQMTEIANIKEKQAPTGTDAPPSAAPTYTPYPTYTAMAPNTLVPTIASTDTPTAPTEVNMEDRIRGANILVFEDIKGYYDLNPWIQQAMSSMDFSKGRVVEVGDKIGDFMVQLNSPVKWDLIIVGAEARSGVKGEFWDVILDQVNRGSALIVEIWYLDKIASGRIQPLLGKCGLQFQKDWFRDYGAKPENYAIYWLDQTNELFTKPNVVGPLFTAIPYWFTDAGDLINLGPGGDAKLVAGLYPKEKSNYGVLATCLGGRMILQTFSTHDYRQSQVVPLWQNYITFTLTNHFKAMK
jgi:hypothetical protein